MPVVIFTLIMSVYITFHIHNRACLSASAGEQAVSGHIQEDPWLFAAGEVRTERSDGILGRTVEHQAETYHFSGRKLFDISVSAHYTKCRPVFLIRNAKALRDGI